MFSVRMVTRLLGRKLGIQCGYFLAIVALGFLVFPYPLAAGVNHWTPLSNGIHGGRIQTVVCDPQNSEIAYAGTWGAGVYKSTDGGESWMEVNNGLSNRNIVQMAIHPDSPGKVYAGTSGGGLYKTTNGGGNWERLWIGDDVNSSSVQILVLNKAAPETLFVKFGNAIYSAWGGSGVPVVLDLQGAVFRSNDGGTQWHRVQFGEEEADITAIATDPNHADTVYAGTEKNGILKSTDGGATWGFANSGLDDSKIQTIAISPIDANRLWAGGENGKVFRSVDGGLQWTSVDGALNDSSIRVLLPDAANPDVLYAGNGAGVFKTTDGGDNWADVGGENMDAPVEAMAAVPSDPDTLFVGTRFDLFKTSDGAVGWVSASEGIRNVSIRALAVNPDDPDILYAGSVGNGVFKSVNRGADWFAVNEGLTDLDVRALEISRSDPEVLYVHIWDEGVFKTVDGGGHWEFVGPGIEGSSIETLAIHPEDPNIVYSSLIFISHPPGNIADRWDGVLFKTTDGGGHWEDITPDIEVPTIGSLGVAPTQPDTIYIGTWCDGVMKSADGGKSWNRVETEVQKKTVETLAVHPADSESIYAGFNYSEKLFCGDVTSIGDGEYNNAGNAWDEIHYARSLDYYEIVAVNPLRPQIAYAASSQWASEGFFKPKLSDFSAQADGGRFFGEAKRPAGGWIAPTAHFWGKPGDPAAEIPKIRLGSGALRRVCAHLSFFPFLAGTGRRSRPEFLGGRVIAGLRAAGRGCGSKAP